MGENELPDVQRRETVVEALKSMEVLGGWSRSGTLDDNGGFDPDRYIEHLGDYFTDHQIRKAIDVLFDNSLTISGLDGVIIGYSADQIEVENNAGKTITFVRRTHNTSGEVDEEDV